METSLSYFENFTKRTKWQFYSSKSVSHNHSEYMLVIFFLTLGGNELAEPSAAINDTTEDSYVMQMLTSPAAVVVPSPPSSHHRTIAISPEEIAMRLLDYTVNKNGVIDSDYQFVLVIRHCVCVCVHLAPVDVHVLYIHTTRAYSTTHVSSLNKRRAFLSIACRRGGGPQINWVSLDL